MASHEDLELGKIVITKGLVQGSQLAACLQLRQQSMAGGKNMSLSEIMLSKGYINQSQLTEIQKQLKVVKKQFGSYKILSELGRGGMGRVYKALDTRLNRVVALKVLLSEDRQESVERFLREARATGELQHPNIISLHDIGREEGQNYFTMDFIDGKALEEYISESSLTFNKIATITDKIARALYYAHEKGIIHRDIKPANIMITPKGEPIVMDFGLAKVADANKNLSISGVLLGTMYYMSPEQTTGRSRDVDARSDVYSLGVVLYELLTGVSPFVGNTIPEIIQQITHTDPVSPGELNSQVPSGLEAICLKSLEKQKEHRYQSALEFAEDLTRFLNNEVTIAKMPGLAKQWYKKISHYHLVAAAALVFILILIYTSGDNEIKIKIKNFRVKFAFDKKEHNMFSSKEAIEVKVTRKILSPKKIAESLIIYGPGIKLHQKHYQSRFFTPLRTSFHPVLVANLRRNKFPITVQIKAGKTIVEKKILLVLNYLSDSPAQKIREILQQKDKLGTLPTKESNAITIALIKSWENKELEIRAAAFKVIYQHRKFIADTLAKMEKKQQQKIAITLGKLLLKRQGPLEKSTIIQLLGSLGEKANIILPFVIKELDSKNILVRLATINALSKMASSKSNRKKISDKLEQLGYSDPKLMVNITAIQALYEIKKGK